MSLIGLIVTCIKSECNNLNTIESLGPSKDCTSVLPTQQKAGMRQKWNDINHICIMLQNSTPEKSGELNLSQIQI